MGENKSLNEVDEAVAEVDASSMTNDELKQAITKQLEKVRNDGIIVGYKVAARIMMDIIAHWREPGCSHREYERIFKKLEDFYGKALKEDTAPKDNNSTAQN